MNSFQNILVVVSTVWKITVLRNRPQKVRVSVMLVLSGLHMRTESTNCLLVVYTSSLPYFYCSRQVNVLCIHAKLSIVKRSLPPLLFRCCHIHITKKSFGSSVMFPNGKCGEWEPSVGFLNLSRFLSGEESRRLLAMTCENYLRCLICPMLSDMREPCVLSQRSFACRAQKLFHKVN